MIACDNKSCKLEWVCADFEFLFSLSVKLNLSSILVPFWLCRSGGRLHTEREMVLSRMCPLVPEEREVAMNPVLVSFLALSWSLV